MALLVDTFTAVQRAVAGIGSSPRINGGRSTTPTRFNSTVGSTGGGSSWGDEDTGGKPEGGSYMDRAYNVIKDPNNLLIGNWGNNAREITTGSRAPQPARSVPTPQLYDRNNFNEIMPALANANSTLAQNNASIDATIARLRNNQNARNQQFGNSEAAYKNQLAGQLANANLDIQGYDIQQQNFPQWYKFLAEQWGNTMEAGKHDLDFIAQQQVNSANQRLIDWREIQQGKKEVGQQAERGIRDATSAATVSGVIQGAKQDFGDIEQERGNALYGLDLQDQKSRLSETQRRQELSNRRHQLIADLKGFDINTRESQAKLREREQLLGIEAQKARLQPRMLQDAMNVTLANLGLDKVMSQGQFLESLANADAQKQAALSQYLQEASAWLQLVNTWQSTVPGASRVPGGNPSAGKPKTDRQGFR